MEELPRSFVAINRSPISVTHPRTVWNHFDSFFSSCGLQLWIQDPESSLSLLPPDSRPRAPDGFHYRSQHDPDRIYSFAHSTPLVCPARTLDGRDVVIRIVSIGPEGTSHREALKRLASGNIASVIGNHAAPVLQWLETNGFTFAVFPYLSTLEPSLFLFENTGDLLREAQQMLEALEFCHARLVAHRDVFPSNFLCNYYGGLGYHASYAPPPLGEAVKPFRSLFPFKIYLIDFEWAVCFEPNSDPATHLVTGRPPFVDFHGSDSTYGRPVAPEMDSEQPHDPFLADVWQLGTYFTDIAKSNVVPAAASRLFTQMTATSPSERPTASVALSILRQIMLDLSLDELNAPVWKRTM